MPDRDPLEALVPVLQFRKVVGDGVVKCDVAVVYRDTHKRRRERFRYGERGLGRIVLVPVEVALVEQDVALHDDKRSGVRGAEKRFEIIVAVR